MMLTGICMGSWGLGLVGNPIFFVVFVMANPQDLILLIDTSCVIDFHVSIFPVRRCDEWKSITHDVSINKIRSC